MGHLTLGAIGVGMATALLFVTSNGALQRALSAGGIKISDADIATLNGVSVLDAKVRAVLARYDADAQAKIAEAMTGAFADGFQLAFWVALAFAALGLILCLPLDDRKLGRVRA